MTTYTLANFSSITEGIGSVIFGLLRPVCWLILAYVACRSSLLGRIPRRLMAVGALGNFTAAVVFLFVNAGFAVPEFWSDYAQLVATPSTVAFALGFTAEAIKLGGFQVGDK